MKIVLLLPGLKLIIMGENNENPRLVDREKKICPVDKFNILERSFSYAVFQVRVLFHILMDLCKRTAALPHPLPGSQVGSGNIQVRLHYIDGNYTVLPEVVEAALGPHMQVVLFGELHYEIVSF